MSFRNLLFSAIAVGLAVVPGIAGASTSTQLRNIGLTRYNQEHNSVDHEIAKKHKCDPEVDDCDPPPPDNTGTNKSSMQEVAFNAHE